MLAIQHTGAVCNAWKNVGMTMTCDMTITSSSCQHSSKNWTELNQKKVSGLALHFILHRFSPLNCCLSVVLSLHKGDYSENSHVVFVLINSVLLNLSRVWVLFQNTSSHSCFSFFFFFNQNTGTQYQSVTI